MNMAVYIFFAILGLFIGGAIVWLIQATHSFETNEEPWRPPDPLEASFLADEMAKRGHPLDQATVAEMLTLHLAYLEGRIRDEQEAEARRQLELARQAEAARQEAAAAGTAAPVPAGPALTADRRFEPAPGPFDPPRPEGVPGKEPGALRRSGS